MPLSIAAQEAVRQWATPTARDWKDGACASADVETNGLLGRQAVRSLLDETTSTSGVESSQSDRILNPRFVEWLMGVPIGMTDCESSATASFLTWLRARSWSSLNDCFRAEFEKEQARG